MFAILSNISESLGNIFAVGILTVAIMVAVWFVTLPLFALCLYLWHIQKNKVRKITRQSFVNQHFLKSLCLIPFFVSLCIVTLGGIFWRNPSHSIAHSWVINVVNILLLMHLPISITVIWIAKQYRPFVASLSVLQFWISLCAAFVTGMSTTGSWL
ncbi:hypothetical protein K9N68_24905 [Kovacikia minuta CCNUW1]|uniref:hypothetical protein n=1 Tax=Kovacikia minuta TaxID=2931930 RepID=UPI001CCCDF4B|nr:hypothetical protein [Kovacikia minuta]UBF24868.1 hypothetical protein K9N68_24905 [Kovacikia minuta CCNUW1]